jgi:hypothetical protein
MIIYWMFLYLITWLSWWWMYSLYKIYNFSNFEFELRLKSPKKKKKIIYKNHFIKRCIKKNSEVEYGILTFLTKSEERQWNNYVNNNQCHEIRIWDICGLCQIKTLKVPMPPVTSSYYLCLLLCHCIVYIILTLTDFFFYLKYCIYVRCI